MENQSIQQSCLGDQYHVLVAGEGEPFYLQDENPLDFSGYSHLNCQGEVPIQETLNEGIPLMESFVHDPFYYCYSPMNILPDSNVLQDDFYTWENGGFDPEFWNVWNGGFEANNDMLFCTGENEAELKKKAKRCRDEKSITEDELSRYYHMPITKAAKELNIGLTLLKKKCREFKIPRWPYRKMKSLKTLIKNVQELGGDDGEVCEEQLRAAVEILEEEVKMMEKVPALQIREKIKKLRQACFKANYKKRRLGMMVELQQLSF